MRWGLIGSSGLAMHACAPAISSAENAVLSAVLGSTVEKASQLADKYGANTATADLEEFLASPDVQAVWIASPTYLHYDHCIAALHAGKHVLLEKPLAMSARQGWELVDAAHAAGLVLAVGYQNRYVPAHEQMKRLVADGAIGELSVARTYYGVHRAGPPPAWRQKLGQAHWGSLADIGTHHVDLLRMIVGEIADAVGLYEHQLGFETDDAVAAALRFESGSLATLAVTVNTWKQHARIELYGTAGALVAEDTSPRGEGSVTLFRDGSDPEDVTGDRCDPFVKQVEIVTSAMNGADVPYASGKDGARNLEILEKIIP